MFAELSHMTASSKFLRTMASTFDDFHFDNPSRASRVNCVGCFIQNHIVGSHTVGFHEQLILVQVEKIDVRAISGTRCRNHPLRLVVEFDIFIKEVCLRLGTRSPAYRFAIQKPAIVLGHW